MCSSFAVTIPSPGYRNSHQNWCPMAVTSRAVAGFGASWTAWITRAVARNNTTTISIGMIVQASSICVLPYTCAGSRSASAVLPRNFTTEYTSKVKTTTNMIAVMASTNIDKGEIDFADVDSGAKILVRPIDDTAGWAVLAVDQNKNTNI